MNKENTAKLLAAGPTLFKYGPDNTSLRVCGFECGDGWYDLLHELILKIEALILLQPSANWEYFQAQQIKEKYGGLRFYMSQTTEEMDDLINIYEHKSAHICESCGKAGTLGGNGWFSTRCEECKR